MRDAQVVRQVEVVVQFGIEVHLVAHGEPRPPSEGHVRSPQRRVPQCGERARRVQPEEGASHQHTPRRRTVVEHGAAGGGIHVRVGERVDEAGDPRRRREAVGVETQDDVADGGVVAGGRGGRDAALAAEHHARPGGAGDVGAVVGRGVVDDDDLVGGDGLCGERAKARTQVRAVVADGDHDRDGRGRRRGALGHASSRGRVLSR